MNCYLFQRCSPLMPQRFSKYLWRNQYSNWFFFPLFYSPEVYWRQQGGEVKSDSPGLEAPLCHLLTVLFGACCFIAINLRFCIYKLETMGNVSGGLN